MVWARVKCSKEEMTAMLNKGLLTCPLLNSLLHKPIDFLWIFFPVNSISASLKIAEDDVIWEGPAEKNGILYVR